MQTLTCIDNCELDVFILKKILSGYGIPFNVKSADTGSEVIRKLSKYKTDGSELPDIILLDIYMPGFDAWDFLDRMNWLYPTLAKSVEVYVLSAHKYPNDVERARQYPFVKAFILKPITKQVLLKLIDQKKALFQRFTMLEACC